MELKHEKESSINADIIYKHIGLQVIEEDIDSFYIDILGFEPIRTIQLSEEESKDIFDINRKVSILYGSCRGLDMELFVSDLPRIPTYNHICIQTMFPQDMLSAAIFKGYKTFSRRKNGSKTVFISDSNHNVFEVKAGSTKS
jgi:hypothetical protein